MRGSPATPLRCRGSPRSTAPRSSRCRPTTSGRSSVTLPPIYAWPSCSARAPVRKARRWRSPRTGSTGCAARCRVDPQVWTPRRGPSSFAVPKSPRSTRTIALSDTVLTTLAEHVKVYATGPHGLVFHHGNDGFWTRDLLAKHLKERRFALGLPGVTWHSLRHAHAPVLLSAGVSPRPCRRAPRARRGHAHADLRAGHPVRR